MSTGIVKKFVDEKGFGFLTQDNGGNDVFFHFSKVQDFENGMIHEGVRVSYEYEQGERGLQATKVVILSGNMAGGDDSAHEEDDMA